MVADITTSRRSVRAFQACLDSAIARSAWMLRSWNSSMTMVRKSESRGSCWRRAVRMPSVATSSRVAALKAPLEPDVPTDFAANRPPAFEGNPMRDGSSRDASWLEEDDGTLLDERRRDSRSFSGSGLSGHDGSA